MTVWLAIAVIGSLLAGLLARHKGRSPVLWAVLALLFSPLVIAILLGLPALQHCPRCAEKVRRDAEVCRHCSYELR